MSIALSVVALSLIGADLPPTAEFKKPTEVLEASKSSTVLSPTPTVASPKTSGVEPPKELWPLTLRDAIRIGLDNSEIIRVISLGARGIPVGGFEPTPLNAGTGAGVSNSLGSGTLQTVDDPAIQEIQMAPVNSSFSPAQVHPEIMAEVRSIEQQYWSLHQQHAQLQASEKAVELAREVLKREQAELQGHGGAADVAEAEQRLTQYMVDCVVRNSEINETEQRLRWVLGLPPRDNRRIVPATSPTKTLVKRDWDQCLATMSRRQPKLCSGEAIEQHEGRIANACREIRASLPAPLTKIGYAYTREMRNLALSQMYPERKLVQQAIHKQTHALARFFLEIETNYKYLQTASRLRAAAEQRFAAQQAFYEEGRIPIDRYFDALEQSVSAVDREAECKTNYNVSIVALEEVKGTLLEAYGIVLADPPQRQTPTVVQAEPAPLDAAVMHAAHEETPAPQPSSPPAAATGAKTVNFQFTINGGPQPIRIEGTLKFGDDAKMSVVVPDCCQFVGPGTLQFGDDAKRAPGAR